GTLVGTLSGFLSGVYVPIGALPEMAQTIMKCYPGAYSASLFRQILLDEQLKTTFGQVSKATLIDYKATFGIGLSLNGQLTTAVQDSLILAIFSIGLLGVVAVVLKIRRAEK
ncbi:MAG: ABC transporter permease, partial [Lactococcus sp.]|nr:ABC transporter permease [Lactococcus sp.]